MIKFLFVLFFSLPLFSIDLKISDFNPQGNVKRVKQVKVSFSDQMVPLGNPKVSSDIFIIDCPKKGKGRWLDDRNYIYEFPEEL
ncbi:MAG: hypothetical protein KDK36_09190, partial [Leptospiraceae bacterium]|nr:hypothetical protein [Leptospiraceae bacterium]